MPIFFKVMNFLHTKNIAGPCWQLLHCSTSGAISVAQWNRQDLISLKVLKSGMLRAATMRGILTNKRQMTTRCNKMQRYILQHCFTYATILETVLDWIILKTGLWLWSEQEQAGKTRWAGLWPWFCYWA
jgi:uncharacterized sodium:solute symporter family permease YidK